VDRLPPKACIWRVVGWLHDRDRQCHDRERENLIGVRSTLIWSIIGDQGYGGLSHGGVPQIVSPP
jgi:hypothetical protein